MPSDLDERTAQAKLRPLTKAVIDSRMQQLIEEIAAPCGQAAQSASELPRPRWIEPAELVRRMSRFLVYN